MYLWHRIVKMSSPNLNVLTLCGSVLTYSSGFLFAVEERALLSGAGSRAVLQVHTHIHTHAHTHAHTHTRARTHAHTHTHTHAHNHTHTHTHAHNHTHTHAHTRAHAHTHTRAQPYTYTHTHAHNHTHTHAHTHAHARTHTHTHTRAQPYTYTHTHTHTQLFRLSNGVDIQKLRPSSLCTCLYVSITKAVLNHTAGLSLNWYMAVYILQHHKPPLLSKHVEQNSCLVKAVRHG